MKYKNYTLKNFKKIAQINKLTEDQLFSIEVVGNVLPFKANNYVIDKLIDWDNIENDPIFRIIFPQKEMLSEENYNIIADLIHSGAPADKIRKAANQIRMELNPHPAGQLEDNVPELDGIRLNGIQHKYRETMLFFPRKSPSIGKTLGVHGPF